MSKYQITEEHLQELEKIKNKYIDNALRTDAMSEYDKEQMRIAMRGLYKNANLDYPGDDKIIFVDSPFIAQFASGIAMALLYSESLDLPEKPVLKETDLRVNKSAFLAEEAAMKAANKTWVKGERKQEKEPDATATSLDTFVDVFTQTAKKYGRFALLSVSYSWRYRCRSAYWPWRQVYGDFFKNVAKLPGEWEKWDPINLDCLHGGVRYTTPDFTIIADRPEILTTDPQNNLHNEEGPALRWRDGLELFYWHGVLIPDTWIKDKSSITNDIALHWSNIEQRRCAQEIVGLENILPEINAELIDENSDPMIGTLYHADMDDIGKEGFLKCKCGTGRTFVMRVDTTYKTALEANASLGGWRPDMGSSPDNFIPFCRS